MDERIKNNVPYTPPDPVPENYQLMFKGDIIGEFDKNPLDTINEFNDKLAACKDSLAEYITKNAELEFDNKEKDTEISDTKTRNTEIVRERDESRREARKLSKDLETQINKVAELQAKLDADDPFEPYTRWEIFKEIFKKKKKKRGGDNK